MKRISTILAAVTLIGLSALTAGCTSVPTSSGSASGYVQGDSMNRACSDGFRPSDGRSCSY
ncbi:MULTISPECIES: hypothetical protein [Rhizobium]|uniref:Lipoprotein n=1 Tax=Rhizobium metallidurans TaxID=1265931 RepID=A0A7W6GAN1_9HYPH|nr:MULTISPECIES: hypothetical protein [Rhizobium]MBB3964152.1 hypothetical protein [Rhizobium metallidurans]